MFDDEYLSSQVLEHPDYRSSRAIVVEANQIDGYAKAFVQADVPEKLSKTTNFRLLRFILNTLVKCDSHDGSSLQLASLCNHIEEFKRQKLPASAGGMKAAFERLEKLGFIKTARISPTNGGKARPIHCLTDLIEFKTALFQQIDEFAFPNTVNEAELEQVAPLVNQANKQLSITYETHSDLEYAEIPAAYMPESLSKLLGFFSKSRNRKKNLKQVIQLKNGNRLEVELYSVPEVGVIKKDDISDLLLICTIAMTAIQDQILLGKEPTNEFIIDLKEHLEISNSDKGTAKKDSGESRRVKYDIYRRAFDTTISITKLSNKSNPTNAGVYKSKSYWEDSPLVSYTKDQNEYFRFITEMTSVYETETENSRPRSYARYLKIKLHSVVFEELKRQAYNESDHGTAYLWHKQLLRHRNGTLHLLYQVLNQVLPRSGQKTSITLTEQELHTLLADNSTLSTFRNLFKAMMADFLTSKRRGHSKAAFEEEFQKSSGEYPVKMEIIGFHALLNMEYGEIDTITFTRLGSDRLTGKNSAHKKKREKQLRIELNNISNDDSDL